LKSDYNLSDEEILFLHLESDCFVSLARTEGWGLGAFEAARLAKPIIMTGYGGQLDYLNPQLSYLIDYELVPVHEPIWSANYRSSDLWAEPSIDQAVHFMKEIFNNPDLALDRAKQQAKEVRTKFSQQVVMLDLLRVLNSTDEI
ncbi:MAG: glycosyltransferase, partial [Burkholderiaceae bacterium]|nr:glycosyltransferase [Burkholderiaceae bacterium]